MGLFFGASFAVVTRGNWRPRNLSAESLDANLLSGDSLLGVYENLQRSVFLNSNDFDASYFFAYYTPYSLVLDFRDCQLSIEGICAFLTCFFASFLLGFTFLMSWTLCKFSKVFNASPWP